MQARCAFGPDEVTAAVPLAPDTYSNMTIECDPHGQYANFTMNLPLSPRINYTCKFFNAVERSDATSPVTVLKSHSE